MLIKLDYYKHLITEDLELREKVKEDLTFDNPKYLSAVKYSKYPVTKIPKHITYYHEEGNVLTVPRGYTLDIKSEVEDKRVTQEVFYPPSKIELREDQEKAFNNYLENTEKGLMILQTGKGKAQPLDTPILTPKGFIPMRDVKIGTEVIGEDGKPYKVNGIYPQGMKEVYKITFKDGTSSLCCKEHLWKVRTTYEKRLGKDFKVLSLTEILELPLKSGRAFNLSVPVNKPVQFNLNENLIIPPYVLGLLIGDGCLKGIDNPKQSNCYFSTVETDIINKLNNEIKSFGTFYKNTNTQCQYIFTSNSKLKGDIKYGTFFNEIRDLKLNVGSNEKFIPKKYLYSSVDNRRELLKGLFDTDGCVRPNGSYVFNTSSIQLAEDFMWLCRSLGYRPLLSVRDRVGEIYSEKYERKSKEYSITIPTQDIIFTSEKHHTRYSNSIQNRNRKYSYEDLPIISIEKVSEEECQCISVDSKDHTYLCDDFIVTHNTVVGLYLAGYLKQKTLVIVHKDDLVSGWKNDSKVVYGEDFKTGLIKAKKRDVGEQVTIATIQTLNRLSDEELYNLSLEFGCVIVDEVHHASSPQYDLVNEFWGKYRIGLTATLERSDSLVPIILNMFGGISYINEVREQDEDILPVEVNIKASIINYIPHYAYINNKYVLIPKEDWGKYTNLYPLTEIRDKVDRLDYHDIDNTVVEDLSYINTVTKDIILNVREGRSCIAFFNKKAHIDLYEQRLVERGVSKDLILKYYGDSKESKEDMKECAENRAMITLATYSIATEGTNVKRWEVAFLVSSLNSGKNVEQAIGRIRRTDGKKRVATVYDYYHPKVLVIDKHIYTRLQRYKKLKFKINRQEQKVLFSRGFKR